MSREKGWVKVHRCILDKPIWLNSTPEQKTVLLTVMLMANHNKKEWEWAGKKFNVEPGQMVTSASSICEKAGKGVSRQNVRSSLKRFEKLQFLTMKSTKMGMLITVLNWDSYQDTQPSTQPSTQPRGNQGATTNKNVRTKEDKEPTAPEDAEPEFYMTKKGRKLTGKRLDTFMMFWDSFGYKKGKAEAADAWLKIPSLTDLIVNQICDAAKIENSAREEARANGKTPKMAEGWLSGRRWEDETYQKQDGSGTPEDILKKYGMDA